MGHRHALGDEGLGFLPLGVGKVKVENHLAPSRPKRQHQVGVHHVPVDVDHEVGENPPVVRVIPAAHLADGRVVGLFQRTDLDAGLARDFGAVMGVIQGAGQARVDGVDVVAAVQEVIDEHLPVARQLVLAPGHEPQPAQAQAGGPLGQRREEVGQGLGRRRRAVYEDQRSPGVHGERHQALLLLAEVGDAVEFGRAPQPARKVIRPAVIAAAQARGLAQTLKTARRPPSPSRTTRTGSAARSAVRNEPGSRTWSTRPATCQVLPKTARRSAA